MRQWRTNGEMITDVAKLGYLDGTVLDATYGEGLFWTHFFPETLVTNDLYKPAAADFAVDYTRLSQELGVREFDSVVFDPDYKLTGTPSTPDMDFRYGTDRPKRWQDRMSDILRGAAECYRVSDSFTLIKCMDQVCSGRMVWQTDEITKVIEALGGRKRDRFDFPHTPRPQPEGRGQKHADRCYSTLLVFERR